MALLKQQRAELIASNEKLQDIIVRTPQVGAELASLERRREALQRSTDEMAAKLAQATLGERMEENQQAERFEVIEAPIVPSEPSRPKRLPLLMLVAGVAMGVGAATALGAEFLGGTIKRSSDLTRKMNQRLLTVVPYIYTRRELRRRRVNIVLWLVGSLIAIAAGLLAIHFFYSPLDILILRMMNNLRSLIN
jgi:capsular polysaccharide biosynthesis protein